MDETRYIFKIDHDGEYFWYSETSLEKALIYHLLNSGYTLDEAMDSSISVIQAEDQEILDLLPERDGQHGTEHIIKTCGEWAKQIKGLVATTCV